MSDKNPKRYKKWLNEDDETDVPRSTSFRWLAKQSYAPDPDNDLGEQLRNNPESESDEVFDVEISQQTTGSSHSSDISVNQNEELMEIEAVASVNMAQRNLNLPDDENEIEPPFAIDNEVCDEADNDEEIQMENQDDNYDHLQAMLTDPDLIETPVQRVNKSNGEILMMIVEYVLKHNTSHTAVSDLFMLINSLFESPVFEKSRYCLDKLFNPMKRIKYHAVCPQCESYVGSFSKSELTNLQCPSCATIIERNSIATENFFITLDISKSVSNLLQSHDTYYDQVIHNVDLNNCSDRPIKDIYDGKLYRDFVKSLNQEDRYSYASAIFNSDGVPLFRGSKCSIWPIQLIINEIPPQDRLDNPVIYGLWFGNNKPNMNSFFTPFVKDMNGYSTNGINCSILNENRLIKLFPICCCVDSVARAPMQGHVQFNGYFGCNWCVHPGEYVGNVVKYTLQYPEPELRSNDTTIQEMQTAVETKRPCRGVKTATCLINLLYFNIIYGFIVDYMHCVLLGVARQFAEYWFSTAVFMTEADIDFLSKILVNFKPPRHICRLSRPIKERKYWKAREWENWILFYSVPLLQNVLEQKYLSHWALLVEALHILLSDTITKKQLQSAELLLCEFVCQTQLLYGKPAMTFNVHLLLHLSNTVSDWGPLWATSAFPFESENGKLIRIIKSARGIPSQICRQVSFEEATSRIIKKVRPDCKLSVLYFVDKLHEKVTKCFRFNDLHYLNPSSAVALGIRLQDQVVLSALVYKKMLKNGSIYESCVNKKYDRRSDDSFALLTDGRYLQVKAFLFEVESNDAYAVIETLQIIPNINNKLVDDYLIEFEKPNNVEELIPIGNILKNAVCIDVPGYKSYIAAVCNMYRY